MKSKTSSHIYPFPFHVVTRAFWNKYPNEALSHVDRIDVLSRYLDKTTGCLHTARLAQCTNTHVPSWVQSIIGKHAFVYEETICDPFQKTLILKTQNLSFTSVATVAERCMYSMDTDNTKTLYTSQANVTAFVPFLAQKLESVSVTAGEVTASIGLDAMEGLCKDLFESTPVWCEEMRKESREWLDEKRR